MHGAAVDWGPDDWSFKLICLSTSILSCSNSLFEPLIVVKSPQAPPTEYLQCLPLPSNYCRKDNQGYWIFLLSMLSVVLQIVHFLSEWLMRKYAPFSSCGLLMYCTNMLLLCTPSSNRLVLRTKTFLYNKWYCALWWRAVVINYIVFVPVLSHCIDEASPQRWVTPCLGALPF